MFHLDASRTTKYFVLQSTIISIRYDCMSELLPSLYIYIYIYIGFKKFFYVVRHLDSIASYLSTGLHLGFFRPWLSLYLLSSIPSVFLVLSFVSASTSVPDRSKESTQTKRDIMVLQVGGWVDGPAVHHP